MVNASPMRLHVLFILISLIVVILMHIAELISVKHAYHIGRMSYFGLRNYIQCRYIIHTHGLAAQAKGR